MDDGTKLEVVNYLLTLAEQVEGSCERTPSREGLEADLRHAARLVTHLEPACQH